MQITLTNAQVNVIAGLVNGSGLPKVKLSQNGSTSVWVNADLGDNTSLHFKVGAEGQISHKRIDQPSDIRWDIEEREQLIKGCG